MIINDESDVIVVRQVVRDAAVKLNFSLTDVTRIVTAASELARNIFCIPAREQCSGAL